MRVTSVLGYKGFSKIVRLSKIPSLLAYKDPVEHDKEGDFPVGFSRVLQTCVTEELDVPLARTTQAERKYHSDTIEEVILNYTKKMKDKGLAKLFENCFPNTLDTTVMWASRQDTFIITGGVNAMWLRDSMFQVLPYIRFARQDDKLMEMLHGSVRRHLQSVLIDPLR
ncbi:Metal-independent alpha-mannosidase [Trypanosoma melophagium]|uniref:Metal-independent alpha-mannosidase n=1 Tax=Trypanosoma melophagium TaxID=715481 RepID=UPI00351A6D4E|nr:Metal-independent alpha-mannosidase [Trypanosoma melophagium]